MRVTSTNLIRVRVRVRVRARVRLRVRVRVWLRVSREGDEDEPARLEHVVEARLQS